ncbi:hypothetical protein ACM46_09940 [Chryseobacterium angstadtii]|uniref:Uncharacterized protein n=1 Tax=Chryseobacterium angstadtii TaxID=558151 RepID=A0A0J7L683_9FLAO|nr:hypothetical protein ACM46_09940 [Chryseobacterium angstadtii]
MQSKGKDLEEGAKIPTLQVVFLHQPCPCQTRNEKIPKNMQYTSAVYMNSGLTKKRKRDDWFRFLF